MKKPVKNRLANLENHLRSHSERNSEYQAVLVRYKAEKNARKSKKASDRKVQTTLFDLPKPPSQVWTKDHPKSMDPTKILFNDTILY